MLGCERNELPSGMNDGPVLFGTRRYQTILEEIHLGGLAKRLEPSTCARLTASGLVVPTKPPRTGSLYLTLDARHPAYDALRAVLAATTGAAGVEPEPSIAPPLPFVINPVRPLAHPTTVGFRILSLVSLANKQLTVDGLARRIPDVWSKIVIPGALRLVDDGVLAQDAEGRLFFATRVPSAFVRLVAEIAAHLGQHDIPRAFDNVADKRPIAFNRAADGAPLLFGTDALLRNLMALAKHGPLDYRDLRRITGAGHVLLEGKDQAPFGRGAMVRVWRAEKFEAVALDTDYPVYEPLRRLLLRLESVYPLPPFVAKHPTPELPPRRAWIGDQHVIFGSEIPTAILMTIGTLGWTFEALCVTTAVGYHRENVKKAMRRLEADGILTSDRPRRPGFDVRVVTIAASFPAKAELEDLLRACAEAWPAYAARTRKAIEYMIPKTRTHLRNRGLLTE